MLNENFAGSLSEHELHMKNLEFINRFIKEEGVYDLDMLVDPRKTKEHLEYGKLVLYEPDWGGGLIEYMLVDHTWNSNGCTTTEHNDEVRKEMVRIFYNMAVVSGREFEINCR